MSEPMQTLWFEDVGFLNEQMLDTPVGRFSIRQTGIFLVFGLLAWIASLISEDLIFKIVTAGAIFFTGAAIFTRKIKTIPPEIHLLYMIGIRRSLQIKQKSPKTPDSKQPIEQTCVFRVQTKTANLCPSQHSKDKIEAI